MTTRVPAVGFIGKMDYWPNVDAACFFVKEVWPLLLRKIPDATFTIIGASPNKAVRRLARHPGVSVTGTVPNALDLLSRMHVVVAPMRIGGGIQNKVLQSMMLGIPVIATPRAVRGLSGAIAGKHYLEAVRPDEFLYWLEYQLVIQDDFVGREGRAFVKAHFKWDTVASDLRAAITS